MTTTNDQAIEAEIQAKGLTAPRVTPADIEANIKQTYFFTAEEGAQGALAKTDPELGAEFPSISMLTFCVLVLRNGFTVTGESACASPENFDAEIGRKIARANAVQKIWPLMGYALRERLAARNITTADAMAALKASIKEDPEYAWSWHCAIWSGAHDEGLETGAANRAAARVMHMAFDCDTSKNANFSDALPIPAPDLSPAADAQGQ